MITIIIMIVLLPKIMIIYGIQRMGIKKNDKTDNED